MKKMFSDVSFLRRCSRSVGPVEGRLSRSVVSEARMATPIRYIFDASATLYGFAAFIQRRVRRQAFRYESSRSSLRTFCMRA